MAIVDFFAQAVEGQMAASLGYLENLQGMFAQDQRSGLIEVDLDAGRRVIFLYLTGNIFGIYLFDDESCRMITAAQIGNELSTGGEMEIRYVQLPSPAARMVWQAIEWYPPVRDEQLRASQLPAYLQNLRNQTSTVLLQIIMPAREVFLLVQDGIPVVDEAVMLTERGFHSSSFDLRHLADDPSQSCRVLAYELNTDSPSFQALVLRQGMMRWIDGVLEMYQQMVGRVLMHPLDYELNTVLRMRHLNIRLVGSTIIDHHFCATFEMALDAYRQLLELLTDHMVKVLGKNLVQRILHDAYQELNEREQGCLERLASPLKESAVMG